MSETGIRAFLGLPLPEARHPFLQGLQDTFREAGLRASWVPPENFHLTLHFIGHLPHDAIDDFDHRLGQALRDQSAVHLTLVGAGAFPGVHRPKVIWAGVRELAGSCEKLYHATGQAVTESGFERDERAFHPHITLCRLRRPPVGHARVAGCFDDLASRVSDDFWVDSVALWKSELRRGGARYHQIKEYPLQCLPNTSSPP